MISQEVFLIYLPFIIQLYFQGITTLCLTKSIPAYRMVVNLILFDIAITLLNVITCQNDNVKVILPISPSLGKRRLGWVRFLIFNGTLSHLSLEKGETYFQWLHGIFKFCLYKTFSTFRLSFCNYFWHKIFLYLKLTLMRLIGKVN